MSKKIVSVILTLMLLVATTAVAAFSTSAAETEEYYVPQPYVPSAEATAVGFNRYFLLLPDDWCNNDLNAAGIYWWEGTDPCGAMDGSGGTIKWPGYRMTKYPDSKANVWYCDVPKDAPNIVFNNAFDGGTDKTLDRYTKAVQTTDIGSEYYDPGESDNYPSGTESFNNMIYIVDPERTGENVDGKLTYYGEWYFYHGDGQWDTEVEPTYGGAAGEAPHPSAGETEPPTAGTQPTTSTEAPSSTAPTAAQGATSKVSTADTANTTVAGNGTIATGTLSFAVVLLVVAAAVVGVVVVIRKREIEK